MFSNVGRLVFEDYKGAVTEALNNVTVPRISHRNMPETVFGRVVASRKASEQPFRRRSL